MDSGRYVSPLTCMLDTGVKERVTYCKVSQKWSPRKWNYLGIILFPVQRYKAQCSNHVRELDHFSVARR